MTRKFLLSIGGGIILCAALTGVSYAQDTTTTTTVTKTVQNPDGTYTVIQYPVDKEVVVDLTPVSEPIELNPSFGERTSINLSIGVL